MSGLLFLPTIPERTIKTCNSARKLPPSLRVELARLTAGGDFPSLPRVMSRFNVPNRNERLLVV